ncbi:MAG: gamma-glutamylcyclotransferase [Paracoccaceae bacterium]|jgi:hypothetical protein|nr:gamma-glutamylcyclotransferase [Paracoccaceae bacterium]
MRRLRRLALPVLIGVWALWFCIAHAPVYLPAVTPAITAAQPGPDAGSQRVFGYATLTHPLVRVVVIGRPVAATPAQLEGFTRAGRNIQPDPGARLEGQVFTVGAEGLLRLDRYERLGARYRRDMMRLSDGTEAWVYRLLPDAAP